MGLITWYHVFATELVEDYDLLAKDSRTTFPPTTFPQSVAFQYTLDGPVTRRAPPPHIPSFIHCAQPSFPQPQHSARGFVYKTSSCNECQQDLAGYKNYSVVMATRSLIQLFKSVHTELLR